MNPIYFQLKNHIFAANYREQIILLDTTNNEYFALGKKASKYILLALSYRFKFENNEYLPFDATDNNSFGYPAEINNLDQFNKYIINFLKKNFIESCISAKRKNNFAIAAVPLGLSKIEWVPTTEKKGFSSKIRFLEYIEALLALIKIHSLIRRKGLQGLIELLNTFKNKTSKFVNTPDHNDEIKKLCYILDRASIVYFKKTSCLPWAATLVYLLFKRSLTCDLVIGVQTIPFYAHAWVELYGEVLNDNPEIQERLAPIFRLSFDS